MKVITALGELELSDSEIFRFEQGIFGFENLTQWTVRETGESGLSWLVSLENPNIAFVLWDVKQFLPDYTVAGYELNSNHQVYSILTIRQLPKKRVITANLLAPVILETAGKTGCQFVQNGSEYSTQALLYAGEENAC